MTEPLLSPMATELLEWGLSQPAKFWCEVFLQAVGAVASAWKGTAWGVRVSRWTWAVCMVMPALAVYRWMRPTPDPLLAEMLAALDTAEVAYDPRDGILTAEPVACTLTPADVGVPYEVLAADLAGQTITPAMLGVRGWRRLQARVREVVIRLEGERLAREEEARQARVQAERTAALEAARQARARASTPALPPGGKSSYSGTLLRVDATT